jgi:hypothetical protein
MIESLRNIYYRLVIKLEIEIIELKIRFMK